MESDVEKNGILHRYCKGTVVGFDVQATLPQVSKVRADESRFKQNAEFAASTL